MDSSRKKAVSVIGVVIAAVLLIIYFVFPRPAGVEVVDIQYIIDGRLQPMLAGLLNHPAAGLTSTANIQDNQIRLLADDRVQYLVTYQSETAIAELYGYFKEFLPQKGFSIVSDMPDSDFASFSLDASDGRGLYHIYAVQKDRTAGRSSANVAVSFLIR